MDDGAFEFVSGWLNVAQRIDSPNFDARPEDCDVDLIVIHAISLPPRHYGSGDIDRLFLNCLDPTADPYFEQIAVLRVSAHFLIQRDGFLKQFVSVDDRAWHCGESSFHGRYSCNDFAVGIELEGCDEHPFTVSQYDVLNELLFGLGMRYQIDSPRQIVGHSDVSPRRKTDPGPHFDWSSVHRRWRVRCDEAKASLE